MKDFTKRYFFYLIIIFFIVVGFSIFYYLSDNEKGYKNIIIMIGDGMGSNHIIATEMYKGEKLNIQKIPNITYVKTNSVQEVTDSAAAATTIATGKKTNNDYIGKDQNGNDLENIFEYAKKKNKKTGFVVTQIINHATPAGFTIHNISRTNYDEIALSQINQNIDLMFGGGQEYFDKYTEEMNNNNFKYIRNFNEIGNVGKNQKVIGSFAYGLINDEVKLSAMTSEALSRLENKNGFLLMIEGSNIDTYSHSKEISKVVNEMIEFDDAIKVAMDYVDKHEDTILIVTADHETGGIDLSNVKSKEDLDKTNFSSNGSHTNSNVPLYVYCKENPSITKSNIIDNTDIYQYMKKRIDKGIE